MPNSDALKASFKTGSILFSRDENFESNSINYTITILDERGNAVDLFTDDDLSNSIDPRAFPKMRSLYTDVSRQISGADKLIDDLITELEDDIPF